jgi:hypothetical protein
VKAAPRFRLTSEVQPERELHENVVTALDKLLLPPAMFCAYPAGALQLTAAQAAQLTRLGLRRGYPDLILFFYGTWGVELKRARGGRLSKTRVSRTRRGSPRILEGQEDVFPRLIASGGFAAIAICHSVDEVLAQLASWGIPLRGHVIAA